MIGIGPSDNYSDRVKELCDAYVPLRNLDADGKNPIRDLALIREFRVIIRSQRIELAFTFTAKPNIFFSIAAKGAEIAVVPTVNGLGNVFINPSRLSELMLKMYRFAFRHCLNVILQNPDDLNFFLKRKIILPEQGRLTAGSGVDVDRFAFCNKSFPGRPRNVLFSARLVREKGIYEFLEAARKVRNVRPNTTFKVIGMAARNPSSLSEEEIKAYAKDGLIEYEGHTDAMDRELAAADVLVLPSYYREGVPRILLEGLAIGRPIITADTIGCRETVIDGLNGRLVPPRDAAALSDAILSLVDLADDKLQGMSRASRKLAEGKFNEQKVITIYRSIVKQVTEL